MQENHMLSALIESNSSLRGLSHRFSPSQWLTELSNHIGSIKSFEQSFISGFYAHCVGYAFAAAYQNAIRDLFKPSQSVISSFSITEQGSANPQNIRTSLNTRSYLLNGTKSFVVLAENVQHIYVLAVLDTNLKCFKIISLPVSLQGIDIKPASRSFIIPEINHGVVHFSDVSITEEHVLQGDAYSTYVSPFRTIEGVHILNALLGYLYSVSMREDFQGGVGKEILSTTTDLNNAGQLDLLHPHTQSILDEVLIRFGLLVENFEDYWQRTGSQEYFDWHRDKVILNLFTGPRIKHSRGTRTD